MVGSADEWIGSWSSRVSESISRWVSGCLDGSADEWASGMDGTRWVDEWLCRLGKMVRMYVGEQVDHGVSAWIGSA